MVDSSQTHERNGVPSNVVYQQHSTNNYGTLYDYDISKIDNRCDGRSISNDNRYVCYVSGEL